MGSTRAAPRPLSIGEKKPSGPRVHLAPQITKELMTVLRHQVIRGEAHHPSEERECYEVARDLRRAEIAFNSAIYDLIPGGVRGRGMTLMEKIVMVFTDTVSNVLIRPGPTPEDRQASDIAIEANDLVPRLELLVAQVIAVDDKAQGLVEDVEELAPLF